VFVDGSSLTLGLNSSSSYIEGELVRVLEDVVNQRELRLLSNEVDEFPWCRPGTTKAVIHSSVFDRIHLSSLQR